MGDGDVMMLIHQLCCVLPGVQKIVKRPLVYLVKTCRTRLARTKYKIYENLFLPPSLRAPC